MIYSDKNIKTEKAIEIPRNSIFNLKTCICKDIESQPPQYYNESTIVKKLESSALEDHQHMPQSLVNDIK